MRISREVLHSNERFSSSVAPWSSSLALLSIGCEVEGDEENEVGAENAHASECSEFLACADSVVRHPLEIDACEVSVGSEVDEAKVDDELDDL